MKYFFHPIIPCLFIICPVCVISQDLEFYREDIVFRIQGDRAETDAVYHFCNVGEKDIRTILFYPFPENTMGLIDSFVVMDLKSGNAIAYYEVSSGIRFDIAVKAFSTSEYRVYYAQKISDGHFRYILKSTSAWGKPLEFANFELRVPSSIIIDSLSYPADSNYILEEIQYFIWRKSQFMPDRDFEVFFHE